MAFRMDQLLRNLSRGLDYVEMERLGSATTNHGKRIAVMISAMGRHLGWRDDQIVTAAACGLLHDNAIAESAAEFSSKKVSARELIPHCIIGEKNASSLPFPTHATDIIKYHHERMDKSGPFGINPEETPLAAQFIALADDLDLHHRPQGQSASALADLRKVIMRRKGTYYSPCAADALLHVLNESLMRSLTDDKIDAAFAQAIPAWYVEIQTTESMGIAETISRITDYKSSFTAKHSTQIANRAHWMARFYGLETQECIKVYMAASLHDIGKLVTPIAILEKPGKLTKDEFQVIKDHVYWSYMMLRDVEGLKEICRWASTHHRKLDGTGYPELPAEYLDLDFVSRLIACIDIYQAVRETRPYHPGRTHEETMAILYSMADKGEIDRQIVQDMNTEMARFPGAEGDVPPPEKATPI